MIPNLERLTPPCPLCRRGLVAVDGGYQCHWCRITWDGNGKSGRLDGDVERCHATNTITTEPASPLSNAKLHLLCLMPAGTCGPWHTGVPQHRTRIAWFQWNHLRPEVDWYEVTAVFNKTRKE